MPFQNENKLSVGRPKGSQSKLTTEVKDKLQDLMDNVLDSIDVSKLDDNQKLKLLQIGVQYIVPKLKHTSSEEGWFDQPLFPTAIDIISKDEDGGWKHDIRPLPIKN
jgi:hypothetical protein